MKHPLQTWREAKQLSQAAAAQILKCTQGTISHIEIGRNRVSLPRARMWEKITGAELKAADLLFFEFPNLPNHPRPRTASLRDALASPEGAP